MIAKRTLTSLFMLPTLGIPRGALREHGFVESFSMDSGQEYPYENAVYVLFKPENHESFNIFLNMEYERTSDLIDDYDYDGGYVVLVYLLTMGFYEDFLLIKKGKYSKTSEDFKDIFPDEVYVSEGHDSGSQEALQSRVFRRCPELRTKIEEKINSTLPEDAEVWEIFDLKKETLNYETIIKPK